MKKSGTFSDILRRVDAERARKAARKLPGWPSGVDFHSSLALEQCSSGAAASYKAELASRHVPESGAVICDLTGGLGSDSLALSRVAGRLHYFERDRGLLEAVRGNFRLMGADNVEFHCETVGQDTAFPDSDLIFADPARRDGAGRKVFFLEDCSPNLLGLLPALKEASPVLLFKLSPMADVAMLASRLGRGLREVHVVSVDGEVKELLCLMERGFSEDHEIVVAMPGAGGEALRFFPREEAESGLVLLSSAPRPGQLLLEPCAALLKSGAFRLPCARLGVAKLDVSTHLYLAGGDGSAIPCLGAWEPLFGKFRVIETLPLSRASLREAGRRYPKADVSAKNIRMDSESLRGRLGVASCPGGGGGVHIFGCGISGLGPCLVVTERLHCGIAENP